MNKQRGTKERRERLFDSQERRCYYCGRKMSLVAHSEDDETVATLHRLVPKSQGGTDRWDNLVAACHRCCTARNLLNDRQFQAWLTYRFNGDRPLYYQLNDDHPMFCYVPRATVAVDSTLWTLTGGETVWDLYIPAHPLERWIRRVRKGRPMDKTFLSLHLQDRAIESLAGLYHVAVLANTQLEAAFMTWVHDQYVGPPALMIIKLDKFSRSIRLATILTPTQALSRSATRRAFKHLESLERRSKRA